MPDDSLQLDINLTGPTTSPPSWFSDLARVDKEWRDQTSPWTGARWEDGCCPEDQVIRSGKDVIRQFANVKVPKKPEEDRKRPDVLNPGTALILQAVRIAGTSVDHSAKPIGPAESLGGPEKVGEGIVVIPQSAWVSRPPVGVKWYFDWHMDFNAGTSGDVNAPSGPLPDALWETKIPAPDVPTLYIWHVESFMAFSDGAPLTDHGTYHPPDGFTEVVSLWTQQSEPDKTNDAQMFTWTGYRLVQPHEDLDVFDSFDPPADGTYEAGHGHGPGDVNPPPFTVGNGSGLTLLKIQPVRGTLTAAVPMDIAPDFPALGTVSINANTDITIHGKADAGNNILDICTFDGNDVVWRPTTAAARKANPMDGAFDTDITDLPVGSGDDWSGFNIKRIDQVADGSGKKINDNEMLWATTNGNTPQQSRVGVFTGDSATGGTTYTLTAWEGTGAFNGGFCPSPHLHVPGNTIAAYQIYCHSFKMTVV